MARSASSAVNWLRDQAERNRSARAFREVEMKLIQDKALKKDVGNDYGKYLGTYFSARREARADLFDCGGRVTAYITYPTGLNPTSIEDRYVEDLLDYAQSQGFADRFRFVHADYV
jgi:hypothetical protein